MYSNNYPPGAIDDPRAPWNEATGAICVYCNRWKDFCDMTEDERERFDMERFHECTMCYEERFDEEDEC
jgi:hypothetical protein